MRVALISREYPPDTGWGGIGTFMYHLAHGLKDLGHDVEVFSLVGDRRSAQAATADIPVHRAHPIKLKDDTGLLNFCLPVSRPMLEENLALWQTFMMVHKDKPFDIIEAPEHFAEGAFAALAKPVPLVLRLHTPHSKLVNERFHNFNPTFDHQFLTALESFAMLAADKLVSPSEDLAQYVANDLSYDVSKISIIRNPVDAVRFSPEGPVAVQPDGKAAVLFVGRLEERKGVHVLIDAVPKILKETKDVRFVIIGSDTMTGDGHRSVLAQLQQTLAENGGQDAVTFIPHVPLDELPAYYRTADVMVLPSLYENAPCTILEAMSCGKPIVTTSAGGSKEYAVDGVCGLIVPPRDSDALATALISLIRNSDLRATLGRNSRTSVLENYTAEHITRETVKLYEQVCERRQESADSRIYKKDPSLLLDDFTSLLSSCEKTLYDLVFVHSINFRFDHWITKAKKNPGEIFAKILASRSPAPQGD